MNVVSYSLYGNHELYIQGALRNAAEAIRIYKGWEVRFYLGRSVPESIERQLTRRGAVCLRESGVEDFRATLWRFRPFSDPTVHHVIARDCDSSLSERERGAVDEWIETKSPFHIMRDHPDHIDPILAGMCGGVGGVIPDFELLYAAAGNFEGKRIDQDTLGAIVYPTIASTACVHDSFCWYELQAKPFPTPRRGLEFIGEVIQPDGAVNIQQRARLDVFQRSPSKKLGLALRTRVSGAIGRSRSRKIGQLLRGQWQRT